MPNRDGTGPRWAQRPAAAAHEPTSADATPAATTQLPGCRGQGGSGRGLGRGRGANGPGFGCGRRRWAN
jgi:hypothetical protein